MAALSPEEAKIMQEHASDDKKANLYACVACCMILPVIAVTLRFLARRRIQAPFKADDYLVLSALVSPHGYKERIASLALKKVPLAGMNVCTALATYGGMGRHSIFAKDLAMFAKVALIFDFLEMALILSVLGIHCGRSLLCLHYHPSKALCALSISPLVSFEKTPNCLNGGSHSCFGLLNCTDHCGLRTMYPSIEDVESIKTRHMHKYRRALYNHCVE